MSFNSTERFSKTVSNYIKFRPGYPESIIDFMQKHLGMNQDSIIADIGSGTGKLTKLFLEHGNPTYAVEPNQPMREAAEDILGHYPNFISIDGTSESSNLEHNQIDFIVAAQAFHWFNIPESRKEFLRILKPGGKVLLIWNKRVDTASKLMKGYNNFIETYSTDYQKVNLRYIDHKDFQLFFGHNAYQLHHIYNNIQHFDLEGLKGRYLSCSYALAESHGAYSEAMQQLEQLFHQNAVDGKIQMVYRTEVYYGDLV